MPLPRQILISELLRSRLRDELGQDLGVGHQVWMHPPCHRLLGWSSRPSAFGPRRSVWRLDQLVDWLEGQVEVEGEPADTEQPTLDLLTDAGAIQGEIIELLQGSLHLPRLLIDQAIGFQPPPATARQTGITTGHQVVIDASALHINHRIHQTA